MNIDNQRYALDAAANLVTLLSEDNGLSADDLYKSLLLALEDEIEWHQVAVERMVAFQALLRK